MALNPIEVPMQITNIGAVKRDLNDVAMQLIQLQGAANMSLGSVRGSGSANLTGSGPSARLTSAAANLSKIHQGGGSADAIFDAQYRLMKAEKAMQSAQNAMSGPSIGQNIKAALLSSRIGAGGGGLQIMPLVNKILPLLGEAAMTAVAGVGALAAAAKLAADNIGSFRDAQITSGGSSGQVAGLQGLGNVFGMDLNAMSRQFAETIAHGGIAAGAAGRLGIYDYGAQLGGLNKANPMDRLISRLEKITPDQRTRTLRQLGPEFEGLAKIFDLNPATRKRITGEDAAITAEISGTRQAIEGAAEFGSAMTRLGKSFGNLITAFGKPIMTGLTPIINGLATALNYLAIGFDFIFTKIRDGAIWLWKQIENIPIIGPAAKWAANKLVGNDAQEKNTAAIDNLTKVLLQGTYGGGERARNALNRGFGRNEQLRYAAFMNSGNWEQYANSAMAMGAFSV